MSCKLYKGMFVGILALVCIMPARVYAATCTPLNAPQPWEGWVHTCEQPDTGGCEEFDGDSLRYYRNNSTGGCYEVYDCATCPEGADLVTELMGDCTNQRYWTCAYACAECPDDCPDTAWETVGSYQRKYSRYCDCGTCRNNTASYQCAPGYYGSGTSCTLCPESTDVFTNSARTTKARGTSAAGTTSSANCYLNTGTYYNASGAFSVTAPNCKY